MNIFYAIQATGNGHISRAAEIYPYLKTYGDVDFFLSGDNYNLPTSLPVKYKSKGCSLYYSTCGGLNYLNIVKNIRPMGIVADAKALPLQNYDVIINDFDVVTSLACKLKGLPSVQLGHQASFQSELTPRPEKKSVMGELILKKFAVASKHVGFHFECYDDSITPPIIKKEFLQANPNDDGHITIYLPAYQNHCIKDHLFALPDLQFHWFLPEVKEAYNHKNITFLPISQEGFNTSLIHCHGLITGGGFETPAEALYLGKKVMSIPIQNHYEQECNAAALKRIGVKVLNQIGPNFSSEITNWYNQVRPPYIQHVNDVQQTLEQLMDTYPRKNQMETDSFMFI